jgi:hypothetical protein
VGILSDWRFSVVVLCRLSSFAIKLFIILSVCLCMIPHSAQHPTYNCGVSFLSPTVFKNAV